MVIYSIVDRNNVSHKISSEHRKTISEIKEEEVSRLIRMRYHIPSLLEDFILYGEEAFTVVVLEEKKGDITNQAELASLLVWANERIDYYTNNPDFVNHLPYTDKVFLTPELITERKHWRIYAKETVGVNGNNSHLRETALAIGLDFKTAKEIIKCYSLFIVECIKNLTPVRVPILGAFKLKDTEAVDILGEDYRTKSKYKYNGTTNTGQRGGSGDRTGVGQNKSILV